MRTVAFFNTAKIIQFQAVPALLKVYLAEGFFFGILMFILCLGLCERLLINGYHH